LRAESSERVHSGRRGRASRLHRPGFVLSVWDPIIRRVSFVNLPVLGELPLSGFAHVWFFLFLLVIAGLVVLYFSILRSKSRRLARFASTDMIVSVSPTPQSRWRHVPAVLVALALVFFTIAMAGPSL